MNWLRVLRTAGVPILAAVAVVALISIRSNLGGPGAPSDRPTAAETGSSNSVAAHDEPIWTGGEENADHHWRKHGSEFPEFATRDAYVAGAHAFMDHPPPGTLTKTRDNGDTLFYNPDSNTFAVRASNGAPRTFFRPDSGSAYWERQ